MTSKYRNQPVYVDSIRFDSKAEAKRYGELKQLERKGEIRELRVHERFKLIIDGISVGTYEADFTYLTYSDEHECWQRQVEDVKGMKTALYKFKRKVFEACHSPLKITEIAA